MSVANAARTCRTAAAALGLVAALAACSSRAAGDADTPTSTNLGQVPTPTHRPSAQPTSTTTARPTTTGPVPRPQPAGIFSLVVKTNQGDLPAAVAPLSVASHQPVDPPHASAKQWDTAAWIVQSAYPASPSSGTTYVYGHACHYHVCPFTNLKQARVGDSIVVTTPTGVLRYSVNRIGRSPKSANSLPAWASDSTVANRLVLVTCEFEQGDTSTNNIIVVARLTSATPN
jgi:LPXTG-site transpeptidase (sortase) family protein